MTILTYEMRLDHDFGLMFTNADTHWEVMPSQSNFKNPPVKIHPSPTKIGYGDFWEELVKCASSDFSEGFWEELSKLGCTDSAEDLAAIHLAMLQGELADWRLIGGSVTDFFVNLAFANPSYPRCEVIYLKPNANTDLYLDFRINETDYYEIAFIGLHDKYMISATEYNVLGKRKFNFGWYVWDGGYGHNETFRVENGKIYIEVTEYR